MFVSFEGGLQNDVLDEFFGDEAQQGMNFSGVLNIFDHHADF